MILLYLLQFCFKSLHTFALDVAVLTWLMVLGEFVAVKQLNQALILFFQHWENFFFHCQLCLNVFELNFLLLALYAELLNEFSDCARFLSYAA
jgi:hypothetical protein